MATTIASSATKHDDLLQLRRFFEQIGLDEYSSLIVEKLKVRQRCESGETTVDRNQLVVDSGMHSFGSKENRAVNSMMKKGSGEKRFHPVPNRMKCPNERNDQHTIQKVTDH